MRVGLVFAGLVLLQVVVLKRMDYSSCLVFGAESAEVGLSPAPGFHIGQLNWPVSELAQSEVLAPFRIDFQKHCAGKRGVAAALCVSDRMVKAFPWGAPQHDFYARNFDLVADFDDHVNRGKPGHCVTRSGILVSELLAAGIPARVVEIFTREGSGHNISEVWDDEFGWALIDPSFGGVIGINGRPVSALSALASSGALEVIGGVPFSMDGRGYYKKGLKGGTVLYPSPWRYLRTGPRAAMWPFLGRFARIGRNAFKYGGAQWALRAGIVVSFTLALVLLGNALALLRRYGVGRRRRAVAGGLLELVGETSQEPAGTPARPGRQRWNIATPQTAAANAKIGLR